MLIDNAASDHVRPKRRQAAALHGVDVLRLTEALVTSNPSDPFNSLA
ncbi:MAG: hypothetical protein M3539_09160 [Acidobacteriota bacterium]|nr:hypothetical protein [Acidobacteriota bacterium]